VTGSGLMASRLARVASRSASNSLRRSLNGLCRGRGAVGKFDECGAVEVEGVERQAGAAFELLCRRGAHNGKTAFEALREKL
jgi:hypothetical protein